MVWRSSGLDPLLHVRRSPPSRPRKRDPSALREPRDAWQTSRNLLHRKPLPLHPQNSPASFNVRFAEDYHFKCLKNPRADHAQLPICYRDSHEVPRQAPLLPPASYLLRKSCKAFPAPTYAITRSLSDERAARMPGSATGASYISLPEPGETLNRTAATDAGDRTEPGASPQIDWLNESCGAPSSPGCPSGPSNPEYLSSVRVLSHPILMKYILS